MAFSDHASRITTEGNRTAVVEMFTLSTKISKCVANNLKIQDRGFVCTLESRLVIFNKVLRLLPKFNLYH